MNRGILMWNLDRTGFTHQYQRFTWAGSKELLRQYELSPIWKLRWYEAVWVSQCVLRVKTTVTQKFWHRHRSWFRDTPGKKDGSESGRVKVQCPELVVYRRIMNRVNEFSHVLGTYRGGKCMQIGLEWLWQVCRWNSSIHHWTAPKEIPALYNRIALLGRLVICRNKKRMNTMTPVERWC